MGFAEAFTEVVGIEGGYSNNKKDLGGKTKYGLTEAVARANGYNGDMQDIPLDVVRVIYKKQYWDILRLDEIVVLSQEVACELFDTAINCGVGIAGRFLQQSLNAFNQQGRDYHDVTVDGVVGPMTISALAKYFKKRGGHGEAVLLKALNALQGARYIDITEKRPENEEFVYGWFANRIGD